MKRVLTLVPLILQAVAGGCTVRRGMFWAQGAAYASALLVFALGVSVSAEPNELLGKELRVNGVNRHYWVYVPQGKKVGAPMPAVFVLHGGGGTDAETLSDWFGFNEIADREGFIVVYPKGLHGEWNDGKEKSIRPFKDTTAVDDVGFISAVIDECVREFGVDEDRVYVTGLSNGGMMAHRLGIEIGKRLAAIAPLISNIALPIAGEEPAAPLSVLIMNGTEDPIFLLEGGELSVLGYEFGKVLSTEESLAYWLKANDITSEPERVMLPDTAPDDECRIERLTYRQEGGSLEVLLYVVEGGGHSVPGIDAPDRPRLIGRKCMDIHAAEVVWQFFKRHKRSTAGRAAAAPPG